MGQLGIRIINIVLFTASCFFSAGVFNHVADSQLAPDYVAAFQPVARDETRQPDWKERSAILDRNLFGAKVAGTEQPKVVAPAKPDPDIEARATKLPVELLGTMAGEPASLSTAVINNTRDKKHQVVRVGDTLEKYDHVKVTSIEPRRVLLSNREIVEELLLEKDDSKKPAAPSAGRRPGRSGRNALGRLRDRKARDRAKARRAPQPDPSEEDEARMQQIQGAMAKNLIRDLEPAYDDSGQISGVLVGDVEEGGILAQAGLEADDVIVSLNGIDINSAGSAARVLREMSKCRPMTGSIRGAAGTRPLEITQALLAELNCTN
ncbi:MAG: hypothetical protein GY733_19930 [bacterium]|nr:hypothetical protein [bacterium]